MNKSGRQEKLLVSGDYLAVVRDFALRRGIGPDQLLAGSELDLDTLIRPQTLVKNLVVNRVGTNLYQALEDPISDAVHLGLEMTAATHGSLGVAARCAPDLGSALDILGSFYHTRINSQDVQRSEVGKHIRLSLVACFDEPPAVEAVQHFFDMVTLVSIASNIMQAIDPAALDDNNDSLILSIDGEAPENFPLQLLDAHVKVTFEASSLSLLIPKSWISLPLTIANPAMVRAALAKCEKELKQLEPVDLLALVRQRILSVANRVPTLEVVAAELNMSPATLKRRLKSEGSSFHELKTSQRQRRAEELLLKTDLNLDEIAYQLGFSDASNFTKSFKTQAGMTPKRYRDRVSRSKTLGSDRGR